MASHIILVDGTEERGVQILKAWIIGGRGGDKEEGEEEELEKAEEEE